MKRLAIYCVVLEIALGMTIGVAQVTTSQYDNRRTGATLNEKTLTPTKCECRVDGAVYAQLLFVPSVEIPGKGKHDVLFVATEHDSVYAFDASHPNSPPRTSYSPTGSHSIPPHSLKPTLSNYTRAS